MDAWEYEFYLRVLKVSLMSERSEPAGEIPTALEDKSHIPARPCNILYFIHFHYEGPFALRISLFVLNLDNKSCLLIKTLIHSVSSGSCSLQSASALNQSTIKGF